MLLIPASFERGFRAKTLSYPVITGADARTVSAAHFSVYNTDIVNETRGEIYNERKRDIISLEKTRTDAKCLLSIPEADSLRERALNQYVSMCNNRNEQREMVPTIAR